MHFMGMCFFVYAFQMLVYLIDIKLVETIRNSTAENIDSNIRDNGRTITDLFNFTSWVGVSGFIGLLLAFLISLGLSIKNKWGWFTSVITFFLTFALYKLSLLGSAYITSFFLTGSLFLENIFLEYALWGTLFLSLGALFFFSRLSNRFISKTPS